MKETLQTNVSQSVTAVHNTINTAARILAITQSIPTTMPLEMVKSSIAMTGAVKRMPLTAEENVFQMLLVCHLDTVQHQVVMESLKSVAKAKIAVTMDKHTSNTSLQLILSAVF